MLREERQEQVAVYLSRLGSLIGSLAGVTGRFIDGLYASHRLIHRIEEGAAGDGGSGDGIDGAIVLGHLKRLSEGLATDIAGGVILAVEPVGHMSTQSRGLILLQDGVVDEVIVVVDADEDADIAAESIVRR